MFVSTHSRLKAAGDIYPTTDLDLRVSTHSRLKAAGIAGREQLDAAFGFNTQPPEGGWVARPCVSVKSMVSTHSRLKAAGFTLTILLAGIDWFQHTAA